jgi:hypothetical protein
VKKLDPIASKATLKALAKSEADYNPATIARITEALQAVIPSETIDEINSILKERKRRPIGLKDFAQVGYIHARSIHENDGYSPYLRITRYYEAHGEVIDKIHCKAITDILMAVGFMCPLDLTSGPKKCRQYSLPEDVKALIFLKPKSS